MLLGHLDNVLHNYLQHLQVKSQKLHNTIANLQLKNLSMISFRHVQSIYIDHYKLKGVLDKEPYW